MRFAFPYQIADRIIAVQNLKRRHQSRAVGTRQKLLIDDCLNRVRELRTDLRLLCRGKHIHHSVNRARDADRVERGKHQMSRFRGRDGNADRLKVAHFPDHDDVGILTQRRSEGRGIIFRIPADLPLMNDTALVLVNIFDGVFKRDDMQIFRLIDDIQNRSDCRRFAAARRSRQQNQPVLFLIQIDDRRGMLRAVSGGISVGMARSAIAGAPLVI